MIHLWNRLVTPTFFSLLEISSVRGSAISITSSLVCLFRGKLATVMTNDLYAVIVGLNPFVFLLKSRSQISTREQFRYEVAVRTAVVTGASLSLVEKNICNFPGCHALRDGVSGSKKFEPGGGKLSLRSDENRSYCPRHA